MGARGDANSISKRVDLKATTTLADLIVKKKCFKCQGFRNFQAECPNRLVMTTHEIYEIKAELKQDSLDLVVVDQKVQDEVEEIVEQPDHGDLLVIKRALHYVLNDEEAR